MNGQSWKGPRRIFHRMGSFIRGEEAPTAAEYAIMAGFIGAVIVAAVAVLGKAVIPLFESANPGITP